MNWDLESIAIAFAYPWLLWLLLVPIGIVAWMVTGPQQQVAMPFDHGKQSLGRWWERTLFFAALLPPLLLAVAILIAAAPLQTTKPTSERQLTNIQFVLDVSGSMTSEFGAQGTRYDAAMDSIKDFTSRREGDAFGLTIFGNEVLEWTPLTKDTSAIANSTPFLRPEFLPHQLGGTEIGKAVSFCRERLAERGDGDRLLILLSDGESADLEGSRAKQIGVELAASNVVLYAVHIGDEQPPADLNDLCLPSGGKVFAAADPVALTTVFGHIDKMQSIKLKPSAQQQVYHYFPFTVVGLSLLGLAVCTSFGLRYTPW